MAEAKRGVEQIDGAARETLRLLTGGGRLQPMLRLLLLDALVNEGRSDRPADPEALVSSNARAATEWIGADPRERGKVLQDLLELADALPPSAERPVNSIPMPRKIVAIHEALEEAGLPHAVGGAFALAYYGVPRMTLDIDVNVFVPAESWGTVLKAFSAFGVDLEIDTQGAKQDEARVHWDVNPIHVFFSCDELHEAMQRSVRLAPFAQATIPIPAPEHLVVRKATLARPKDWLDVEQIMVATAPLDLGEIETWLERIVGTSDPRLGTLREIENRLALG